MASSPITSWQIVGKTMETVKDFIFLGSRITANDDCSHQSKRHLLLGKKAMTNLDSILISRDVTWLTKVIQSKLWFFQQSCDFEAQVNKVCHCFHCFPIYLHEVMELNSMIFTFECLVLSQLFHSSLSPSSRGCLVLFFLPKGWCHLHI